MTEDEKAEVAAYRLAGQMPCPHCRKPMLKVEWSTGTRSGAWNCNNPECFVFDVLEDGQTILWRRGAG